VYLHPREALPAQQAIYEGYESLVGSAWGFAHETATHAVRLMLSGLFDRHPGVQTMEEAAAWFDSSLLSPNDAQKIGGDNARRLFSGIG